MPFTSGFHGVDTIRHMFVLADGHPQVIHHEEMNTLESVVDAALYKVLVVPGLVLLEVQLRQTKQRGPPLTGRTAFTP